MYQPYLSYQQTFNQQGQQGKLLQEQDWGNLVLAELKRCAGEYMTAALEASHPLFRQTFQNLALNTVQDQAQLFSVLSQLNGYGSIQMAQPQEIQQEMQQHSRRAEELQSSVLQSLQGSYMAGAGIFQQQAEQSAQAFVQPFQAAQAYSYQNQPMNPSNQGDPSGQGSQSYQGYGQGYESGYTNTGSNQGYSQSTNTNNTNTGYGQQTIGGYPIQSSSQQSSFKSSIPSSLNNQSAKLANFESTEPTRGGNSYNWASPEEGDSSPSETTTSALQSRNVNTNSTYTL